MKHVVIGTAGHVDHGKTTLVKMLTGVDTDRLEEEKRRGMTIELGFAPLNLPNGTTVSIVDVPGHERFVRTMVSGAAGIDFAVLVVAADEGVMPQTREHINILSLLNINSGVIAVTKSDLVDEEWLELVKDDIIQVLEGTTLAGSPVIPVSSVTGEGIADIIQHIELLVSKGAESNPSELFRLPVDRVFTMTGYGTVVTGTLLGGEIEKDNVVEIYPVGINARVRGIQVHGKFVDRAVAGNRCALNLAGIEKSDVQKGNMIAFPGIVKPVRLVDAVLYSVKEKGEITHNQRVHVHIGTKEVLARIRIIGQDTIPQGEKGYIQLKFEEPVIALRGDRFIVRSYSPVSTLGGGQIIFHYVSGKARFLKQSIEDLMLEEQGSHEQIIDFILKNSNRILSIDELWRITFINKNSIENKLLDGVQAGKISKLEDNGKYLSAEAFTFYVQKTNNEFERLYARYPFRFQIDKEEIKSRLFPEMEAKDYAALINMFVEKTVFIQNGNTLMQSGDKIIDRIKNRREVVLVEKAFLEDGVNPRRLQQLTQDVNVDYNIGAEVMDFLKRIGKAIDLGDGLFIHTDIFWKTVKRIGSIIEDKGSTTVAEVRDNMGTSRKLAIALMELLDKIGFTLRVSERRYPGPNFKNYQVGSIGNISSAFVNTIE